MATKKASPVKTDKAPVRKKAVKSPKKAASTTSVKAKTKVSAPKKALTSKEKALTKPKPATKTTKSVTEKAKKTAVVSKVKKEVKSKKSADQLLVDAAVDGILEVKGKNISVLDLRGIINRVCDYYIICQADSSTQVNAIAGSVEVMVKKRIGERPYHTEGFENSEWILVDYVTVVVHVFQSEVRNFYNLESLWADAEITNIAFD